MSNNKIKGGTKMDNCTSKVEFSTPGVPLCIEKWLLLMEKPTILSCITIPFEEITLTLPFILLSFSMMLEKGCGLGIFSNIYILPNI